MEQATKALSVKTSLQVVGKISSLVFNPNDDHFYGTNVTHKSIVAIKGSELVENKFEASIKALDLYVKDNYFVIISDEPAAVYKKPVHGQATKVAWHVKGRDKLKHPTGVTINQDTGDAYITCLNGSIHRYTPQGKLELIRGKYKTLFRQKGLRGIFYDLQSNTLLACDVSNNRIITVNPKTGDHSVFCSDIPDPYRIKQLGPKEYLVTSPSHHCVYVVREALWGGYTAKVFAGSKRGTLDGIYSNARFDCPKGLAINSRECLVGDTNCLRLITLQAPSIPNVVPVTKPRSQSSAAIMKSELTDLVKVGEGTQGRVFKGQWQGQQVIYKQMKSLITKEGEEKSAFMKEFNAWQYATHQSCVSLYGIVDEDSEFGFVAEYCPNGKRDFQFKNKVVLSPVQSIEYAVSLANAINVLHAKKIAHRDIKSGNIMLDPNMRPKLGDFGTSKLLETLSGSATQVGSLNYMAPEIIDGTYKDPFACDVFSFGMLMYELATSAIVANRKVEPITEKPDGFSKEAREMWWKLFRDCTQIEPTKRPIISQVVLTLSSISKCVLGFKCKKHEKSTHNVFISYRAATDKDSAKALFAALEKLSLQHGIDVECLPDGEDWEKCFLYGLQNCKSIVPIISEEGWERMRSAGTKADNVLKEYEHVFKMLKNNQKVEVFPWIVGPTPDLSSYPDSPHIHSDSPIRTTLAKVLKYPSISKEKKDVDIVAEMLMKKIKDMKDASADYLLDIGISLEGVNQADHTVQVSSENITVSELRKQISIQCDIDFDYKFILLELMSPLSPRQEAGRELESIMNKDKKRITIRRVSNRESSTESIKSEK